MGVLEDEDGPELRALTGNLGYARRLDSGVTLDAGVVVSSYFDLYEDPETETETYAEAYVGALMRGVSARVYYSPSYFDTEAATLYGEVEAAFEPIPKLRLSGRVGALAFVGGRPPDPRRSTQLDWSLAASRRFGALELRAAVNGGGPPEAYYEGRPHDKAALIVSAAWSF